MKYNLKPNVILFLILFLAGGLRLNNINKFGLAGDEKYSLFVSQFISYDGNNQHDSVRNPNTPYFTPKQFWSKKNIDGFNDAIARVDTGNGAFYTFLLHYWTKLFGVEDGQLRFLSLIFNLATIFILYLFVKKHLHSVKLALISAFVACISPFFINYSQIARNYSAQFFFTLLSSYLFLEIIEKNKEKKYPFYLYCFYGISILIAELCHISVFPLYFAHGIYIIIFYRNFKFILNLLSSYVIPILGMFFWLKSEGGRWLFHYVNNSVNTYNIMAKSNPGEFLSEANWINIFKQFRHLISCIFVTTEGLYLNLSGIKNFTFTAFCGILAYISFIFVKNEKLKFIFIFGLIILNILTVSISEIYYLILFLNVFLICYAIHKIYKNKIQNKIVYLLILIAIIPLIFLIIFAFKDGNTFRIITRYVGFCYATNLILIIYFLNEIYKEISISKYLILAGFVVQFYFLLKIDLYIFEDKSPRYFTSFTEKRIQNPYISLARKIINSYQKGDTVLYCSFSDNSMPKGYNMPKYSVVDAQLTNFYLPKSAEYIQRIEQSEPDKVFLKKANGKKIELFDFKGTKYRY